MTLNSITTIKNVEKMKERNTELLEQLKQLESQRTIVVKELEDLNNKISSYLCSSNNVVMFSVPVIAKHYRYQLLSPGGDIVLFDNLAEFVRDNKHLFMDQYQRSVDHQPTSDLTVTPYAMLNKLLNKKISWWNGWTRYVPSN